MGRWNPFLWILKTHWEIDENHLKNKNLCIMFLSISRNIYNIFENKFLRQVGIFIENKIYLQNNLVNFFPIHFYSFCMIFHRFFADFSMSFQYFWKRISALTFPLNATEYYTNNSVLSVESIKLMRIIEALMGQNGRR